MTPQVILGGVLLLISMYLIVIKEPSQ